MHDGVFTIQLRGSLISPSGSVADMRSHSVGHFPAGWDAARADEEAEKAMEQIKRAAPRLWSALMRGEVESLPMLKKMMKANSMSFDSTWDRYPAFMLRVLNFRLKVRHTPQN